ncbi:MAG: hypothetical protein ACMXYK_00180 [Candidatus Woesearchaeota archaeon]
MTNTMTEYKPENLPEAIAIALYDSLMPEELQVTGMSTSARKSPYQVFIEDAVTNGLGMNDDRYTSRKTEFLKQKGTREALQTHLQDLDERVGHTYPTAHEGMFPPTPFLTYSTN